VKKAVVPGPSLRSMLVDRHLAERRGGLALSPGGWGADGEVPVRSLRQLNLLPQWAKESIYRRGIPSQILKDHGIDPLLLSNVEGERLVHFQCASGTGAVRIEVRQHPDDRDCIMFVQMADTSLGQIEVLLLIVNDLQGPRFDVDSEGGLPTKFGTVRRNIPEEVRAMEAGLAPGQVRRGLRISRMLLPLMEDFTASLGRDSWFLEPLAYHNAILFEQHGFGYVSGRRFMEWIHQEFQPGGELYEKLDGSTPFRRPEYAGTIRGRSWAIHDGILGRPWSGVKMYKEVGEDAGECTFPGAVY